MKKLLIVLLAALVATTTAKADEGMWLFNALPLEYLKSKYGFEPTDEWSEKLMKSSVRFNVGGSASFVSSNGLVLTNHHVGSDTIFKLSDQENNYLEDGFLAKSLDEELKAPDLELNQLVNIVDVTEKVKAAVTDGMSASEAAMARRKVISEIQAAALEESGLRSDVVTLYGGGRYHLYQYKKYTDVRLVWAPESAAAFFGGDADNFEYPRYCLDACLFRVYENGEPAKIEHFLKWSDKGADKDELVFVSGNPGNTSRIYTVAALKHQRDVRLPYVLDFIRRREVLLQQFGLNGEEQARRAQDGLFGIQNARKARIGMLQGLQDPAVMAAKEKAEADLLAKINADPELKKYAKAWEQIAEVQQKNKEIQGKGAAPNSTLYNLAVQIVELAIENEKPDGERYPEFTDARRQSLMQQMLSSAPIYQDLDQVLLADSVARMLEMRGADDEYCKMILDGKSPSDVAAYCIGGTRLKDVEFRKTLIEGGLEAVKSSDDPLIQLALKAEPDARKWRKITDEIGELETQAYAQIAEATFATQGTSTYPDATFTLRLAFGPVTGYEENGQQIPAWTNFGGAFDHEASHQGQKDYQLPESYHKAREKMNPETPFNFVCTADIIGGNSGSPVVNKDLELVGLIFDGNIQSLTGDYLYTDRQCRAVSVHSSAIREALKYVYEAEDLAAELGK